MRMGELHCQILLEKPEPDELFYRPGQIVSGVVKYTLAKPTMFRYITTSFIGKGKCEWSESAADGVSASHSNKEEYVSLCQCVFKPEEGDKELLPKGSFAAPFQFLLPRHLPSTIKNYNCTISYNIVVKFANGNFINTSKKFSTEVFVYGYVCPILPEPLTFGIKKEFISIMSKKYVSIKAELLRTLLIPGDNIYLTLSINNESDVPITTIKTELVKYFTYVSESKTKYVEIKPLKTTKGYSPSIEKKTVSTLTCIVPTSTNFYSIQNSKILLGEYRLKVTVKFPFPHSNVIKEIPVVIGEAKEWIGNEFVNGEFDIDQLTGS